MDFENFAQARDTFYLASLFFGTALGSLLTALDKTCTLRRRSAWISVSICLLSFALAFLAVTIILSAGRVFTVPSFWLFFVFVFGLGAAVVRYPKAGGYTAIFVSVIFLLWISFSFLGFPRFEASEKLLIRSYGNGQILLRWDTAGQIKEAETWIIQEDGRPFTFEAVSITAHPGYPLIGGVRRGIITQVSRKGDKLFILARRLYYLSLIKPPGFNKEQHTLDLPPGVIRTGINLSVLFDGSRLYFDPPIQL